MARRISGIFTHPVFDATLAYRRAYSGRPRIANAVAASVDNPFLMVAECALDLEWGCDF